MAQPPQQRAAQAVPAAAGRGQAAPAAPTPPARQQRRQQQQQQQQQRADPGQRRGDILAVLPGWQIDIVDVVVTHPVQHATLKGASKHAGHAAQRAEDGKVRAFRKFADAGQYEFVPFALESYGRLGVSGQSFLKWLGDPCRGAQQHL